MRSTVVEPWFLFGPATWRVSFVVVCCCILGGCSDGVSTRYPIEGTVQIDGQPMERGLITFIPLGTTSGPKSSGVIKDGSFAISKSDGPFAGEFLVKIETISHGIEAMAEKRPISHESLRALPPRAEVAPQFNSDSKTKVVIDPDGPNHFPFEVTSVTAKPH